MNKAVFLDKDGTLIPDVPYNNDPERISLFPETAGALRELKTQGFLLVVISNQSGIALGYFSEEQFGDLKMKLEDLLLEEGIRLDGFYHCPHHPESVRSRYRSDCECRKPKPGLIMRACKELNIDPNESWMVGDILNDVEAGNRAGCKTILIDNGNETEWVMTDQRVPTHIVLNLSLASQIIVDNAVLVS
jgi:D-glycero-D-manno-heptose 1,7-bisphosphate phosphatase